MNSSNQQIAEQVKTYPNERHMVKELIFWSRRTTTSAENPLFESHSRNDCKIVKFKVSDQQCPFDGTRLESCGLRNSLSNPWAECVACWESVYNPTALSCPSCENFLLCWRCSNVTTLPVVQRIFSADSHSTAQIEVQSMPWFPDIAAEESLQWKALLFIWSQLVHGHFEMVIKFVAEPNNLLCSRQREWVLERLLISACYFCVGDQESRSTLVLTILNLLPQDTEVTTALHAAISSNTIELIQLLAMDSRTKVEGVSDTLHNSSSRFSSRPIITSVRYNAPEACTVLLRHPMCDPTVDFDAAIYEAAKRDRVEVLKVLLSDYRTGPNRRSASCLSLVVQRSSDPELSVLLHSLLTDSRVGCDSQNYEFVRLMCKYGKENVLDVFLSCFPSFNFGTNYRNTLQDCAYGYADIPFVRKVILHGARCDDIQAFESFLTSVISNDDSKLALYILENRALLLDKKPLDQSDDWAENVFVVAAEHASCTEVLEYILQNIGQALISRCFSQALLKAIQNNAEEPLNWLLAHVSRIGSLNQLNADMARKMYNGLGNLTAISCIEACTEFLANAGYPLPGHESKLLEQSLRYVNSELLFFTLDRIEGKVALGSTVPHKNCISLLDSVEQLEWYLSHIETTQLKLEQQVLAQVSALRNPKKWDMFLLLSETSDQGSFEQVLRELESTDDAASLERLLLHKNASTSVLKQLIVQASFHNNETVLKLLLNQVLKEPELYHAAKEVSGRIFKGPQVIVESSLESTLMRGIESTNQLGIVTCLEQTIRNVGIEFNPSTEALSQLLRCKPHHGITKILDRWTAYFQQNCKEYTNRESWWSIAISTRNVQVCWWLRKHIGMNEGDWEIAFHHCGVARQRNSRFHIEIFLLYAKCSLLMNVKHDNGISWGPATSAFQQDEVEPNWDILLSHWIKHQSRGGCSVPVEIAREFLANLYKSIGPNVDIKYSSFRQIFTLLNNHDGEINTHDEARALIKQPDVVAFVKQNERENALEQFQVATKLEDVSSLKFVFSQFTNKNDKVEALVNYIRSNACGFESIIALHHAFNVTERELFGESLASSSFHESLAESHGCDSRWLMLYLWLSKHWKSSPRVVEEWEWYATQSDLHFFHGVESVVFQFAGSVLVAAALQHEIVIPDLALDLLSQFVQFRAVSSTKVS